MNSQDGKGCTDSQAAPPVRRTEQKDISPSFLGLVVALHKAPELWGLYRLSNKILGGLCH